MSYQITSRVAEISDIDFIVELIRKMSIAGHVNPAVALYRMDQTYQRIKIAILEKIFLHPRNIQSAFQGFDENPSNIDVVFLNGRRAGFQLWFSYMIDQELFVEYHLLAVKDKPYFQRHGCAKHLLAVALHTIPEDAKIVARCRQPSHIMLNYFQYIGFDLDESTRGSQEQRVTLLPEKRRIALDILQGRCSTTK